MACRLLHNLIRRFMPMNHVEEEEFVEDKDDDDEEEEEEEEFITTSDHWTSSRNTMAQNMFNCWRARDRQ